MSREFNFERCWREYYQPEIETKMPPVINTLVVRTIELSKFIEQNGTKHEIICKDKAGQILLAGLSLVMEETPVDLLAEWSETVYWAGHLGPGRKEHLAGLLQDHGAYWKFNMLAVASVIRRNGALKLDEEKRRSKQIHNKFFDHKEGSDLDDDEVAAKYGELLSEEFDVVRVQAVNFRPHPFVIGDKHLNGKSMYLDPKSAPCAMKGCNLDYDEHTSDRVMMLKLRKVLTSAEAANALTKVKEAVAADKVRLDGFGFMPGPNDFPGPAHPFADPDSAEYKEWVKKK